MMRLSEGKFVNNFRSRQKMAHFRNELIFFCRPFKHNNITTKIHFDHRGILNGNTPHEIIIGYY